MLFKSIECEFYNCDAQNTASCSGACQCKNGYYDYTCSIDCTCQRIQVSYNGVGVLTNRNGQDVSYVLGVYIRQTPTKNDREWYLSEFDSGKYVLYYNPCAGFILASTTSLDECKGFFVDYNSALCALQSSWFAGDQTPRDIQIQCL